MSCIDTCIDSLCSSYLFVVSCNGNMDTVGRGNTLLVHAPKLVISDKETEN